MIACIISIDYEIYGNGAGSLRELVYEPAERLRTLFREHAKRFVPFVEAAELEMIEAEGSDDGLRLVRKQLRELYHDGFEIGLHLHPQWYNGRTVEGIWRLDYGEYNLCTLPRARISELVHRGIGYFQGVLGAPDFVPFSFRAGNWLLQPTANVAAALSEAGIRVDSSVFKGGLLRQHHVDYRGARENGYYWSFSEDVVVPDPNGVLLEIPICTRMVPFWRMATAKRIGLQNKGRAGHRGPEKTPSRLSDLLRFRYPLKLDFCRMGREELTSAIDAIARDDRSSPGTFKPIVAIGHTKDLTDLATVESFLLYLRKTQIEVVTFADAYARCSRDARSN